jgi:DNA repair exonuclease SbcCD ATPase subunit
MAQTAEQLRQKSENIIAGIKNMLKNLKQVNAEAVAARSKNQASLESIKAKHEMELAQLIAEKEALDAQITANEDFAKKIEEIIGE